MPPRKHLDLQKVTETAIALADELGFEEVSLARVAEKFEIRIPSLYNYVNGLADLRHAMTLWGVRQLTEQLRRAAVGKAGDDAIRSVAEAYRDFARAHPGIYAATLRAPAPDDTELIAAADELLGIIVAILAPYGFTPEHKLHAIRVLRSMLHGFVDLETAGGFGMALDRDESFYLLVQTLIDGLHQQRG